MPLVFPSLARLIAVTVPSSRMPLKTSPKPPAPMRLSLEKLLVAFVISFPVKILADFPLCLAFNISFRSFIRFFCALFDRFCFLRNRPPPRTMTRTATAPTAAPEMI
ncbi:hypothetical protein H0E87_009532 [Populus deltoides]|uniref:Uncharacterized protein n=1 Tax=Populus deltoides TaxID=3696 RepID=A0A8T2YPH5_POPDE|nr:hypothetical protein H0E87_009532 [Populus deltoides]